MKKCLFLLCLFLAPSAWATKTLSTSVCFQDAQGNCLANGAITFRLNVGAKVIANGQVVNSTTIAFVLTGAGMMPANALLYANDELQPTGTFYIVNVFNSNGLLVRGPENWILSGVSPIDLSTITSVNLPDPGLGSPVLQNPSALQTITGQGLMLTSSAPLTVSGAATFTGAVTCTNINTIRCISPTNPQGWAGSDLGAWINSAFTNCGASACEVDVADGTYTVSTQVAPTTANLFLKFGAVTITWNAALNLSAANGFHLRGIGSGFLQSSGYPDVGAKATKLINGMSNSDLIFATPGTNVVLGGIIIEDVALIGNGASATSGSNIHFNAIQGASNIASVRDFSIQRVYSINAKGNGLQMTGAVFCPGNSCVKDSQINFNQGSNILVEPGASTVFASQIRLSNVDTEGSVTGWGREYEPSFTDVYDNNGTVQGNLLGGALCNGGQCRFLNYHSEGQAVVDIKFLNTAVGGSVMSSSLGGNSASPTGKGIWITGNSAGLVIANNTYSGHAALSDIFMDANVSFVHILDPPTTYSLTDSGQPFNLYFPNGLTKFGFIRFSITLANGANQNIAAGTANFLRITGPSGAFSLGGFTGGADGKILRVMNDTTQVMTINNQDGGSAAANRILTGTGGNVVLAAGNQFCDFTYETLNSLWRLAGCNIGDQPVGATMTQTLTNKILTSPVINGSPTGTGIATLTLKKGSGAGNYTSASTTYVVVDSTNLCNAVTIPTGWKLSIGASGNFGTATAAVVANIALTDNASCATANAGILVEQTETATGAGVLEPFSMNWVINGDGNSHSVALQYKTSAGADVATILNASATQLPTMVFTLMPSN